MEPIPVVVKHGSKRYNIDVDPTSNGETFKFQLFSLTSVEPERQKILVKGGQLKDDADLSKLGWKPGQQLMMLGTPSIGTIVLEKPKEQMKFLEDMTAAEVAQTEGATPAGLQNLGNTCYMNSTLQALRAIPELQEELQQYKPRQAVSFGISGSTATDISQSTSSVPSIAINELSQFGLRGLGSSSDLTASLRDLYKQMSQTQEGFPPLMFLNALRTAYPQFAEMTRDGRGYAQQDAEEAWSQLVSALRQKLKRKRRDDASEVTAGETEFSFVDEYMGGRFEKIEECNDSAGVEAGETPQKQAEETFYKLNCHVASKDVTHLGEGIAAALSDSHTKTSPTLNREVEYVTKSKISRLPKYLPVHFVRFFWKRDINKKAKIMRKVTFPHELDVVEYCTDELKSMLIPVRDKVRELRKEELDIERARKRQKRMDHGEENDPNRATKSNAPTEKDVATNKTVPPSTTSTPKTNGKATDHDIEMKGGEVYRTDGEIEAERAASILAAKQALLASVTPKLAADKSANQTGLYELRGVVTHQGASADSGHYTAYVKKEGIKDPKTGKREAEDGKWWWFNDDRVSEVDGEKIETLAGGGETHSALILLYRAVELPVLEGEKVV